MARKKRFNGAPATKKTSSPSPAPDAPIELAPDIDAEKSLIDIIKAKREVKGLKEELTELKRRHREKKAALETARENLEKVIDAQEEILPLFETNGHTPKPPRPPEEPISGALGMTDAEIEVAAREPFEPKPAA